MESAHLQERLRLQYYLMCRDIFTSDVELQVQQAGGNDSADETVEPENKD